MNLQHLIAEGPHPDLGGHADTYGRLIGSWRGDYRDPTRDGEETGPMEVHFAWALDGRAVQDVWIAPSPYRETSPLRRRMWGTTLRMFDPGLQGWRVDWVNPARNTRCLLVGRRVGDDIVQTGYWDDRPQRWQFRDIGADSFLWQAHALSDNGVDWMLVTEFRLRRVSGPGRAASP